jgi:hypothetical protein
MPDIVSGPCSTNAPETRSIGQQFFPPDGSSPGRKRGRAKGERWIDLPKFVFTPDEPLGRNPFPREAKRHDRWVAAARLAKEYLALHHSTMLARMLPDGAPREEHQAWMADLFAERFNIMAGAILAEFGSTYESVADCEKVVDQLAEFTLAEARKIDPSRSLIVTVTFLVELQIRLTQYREHGVGEAY